jgi:Ni,Fe-hydrogenase III large subunit
VEALIVDVENELKFISREIEILKRKKERVETEREPENLDSHVKAIGLTLHSIYTGYEKILEMLIKGIDGDAPTATDYRSALLKRATYTIPGVRPEIISEETFHLLNALRAYRHKLRRIYTYLVSSSKIMNLTDIALKSFDKFNEDWDALKRYLLHVSPK